LRDLGKPAGPESVEWLALDRFEGNETDIALNRNWIDPGIPFVHHVAQPAHGIVVTSATLTDGEADPSLAWSLAEAASGLRHLSVSPRASRIASPFDYAAQTRIIIVNDIPRGDVGQVAAGFAALMRAAKGGALGLFTAISRLRVVHERIAPALEAQGLLLLAQHVDAMSPATLVEIFRAEENSCLLGTDAVRDGVDVPGRRHPAPREEAGFRRRQLRGPHRPAAIAPGLWPAHPPCRRPRRFCRAGPAAAVAASRGVSRGRAGCPPAAQRRGRGNRAVSRRQCLTLAASVINCPPFQQRDWPCSTATAR
jgi:hypothetical protein